MAGEAYHHSLSNHDKLYVPARVRVEKREVKEGVKARPGRTMAKHHIPKKLGRYKIVREIGRGAMGVVYEGLDPIIGRRVAIKAARRDLLDGEERADEMMERFIREAHAAGQLNHSGIITIYDADQVEDIAFIAMEYMAGGSLRDRLRDRGRLEPKEAVKIAVAICGALSAAHDQGVVHRDVKPANILMHADGGIKVADFGIARVSDSTLTQDGAIVGTPYCMSPEQVMGQKVDGRSDLFSVGVILYEMLTGQRPFTGDVFGAILHKIVNEDPVPPHEVNAGLNENLSRVVMKSLSKEPEKRYQDGRMMAAALRESLKEKPNPAVLALDAENGVKPKPPQHDVSTVLSMLSPEQRAAAPFGGPLPEAPGGTSSFRPRVSRLVKRETLLPAILTTMLLLVIGVVTAMVVLGRQNPAPAPMPVAGGTTSSADLPVPVEAAPVAPKEKTKPPVPQKEKPRKETRAAREKAKEEESKETARKPKEDPLQAAMPRPAQPPEVKPTVQGEAEKSEEKPAKPETRLNKENTPQQPPPPDSPPVPTETTPAAPPAAKEPPTPAPTTQLSPTPEQQPTPPVTPPPAPTQQPAPPVTPTVAVQTTLPPSEENAGKTLAEFQTAIPPQLPADQAQSLLAELPSVGQLTANLWFADTQESWDAANNAQSDKGERYAHCSTSGTVTVIVRDATAPVQPVIDTQVIISASTISIKTPCPQIRVTYEREGYLPVERQYSANSPNQAVADDIVMKSLTVK